MTRPCPWCRADLTEEPSYAGMTWSVAAKQHMWDCQFEDVPAAPAGTADPVSAPSPALPVSSQSGLSGRVRTNFRAGVTGEGSPARNNLQGRELMNMDRAMERAEDDLVRQHNDGLLTTSEFNAEMRDLAREARAMAEEAAQDAYDAEMARW